MKCTFVSNYLNHHQIPVSTCLYELLGDGYRFVQTQPMEAERRNMGWKEDADGQRWLVRSYEEPELAERLLEESDIVIFGGCENEEIILPRLRKGRPVIRYSERIYKDGQWKCITPKGLVRKYRDHIRFRGAPVYLLCAGAYVASDFHLIRAYPEKMLRYGYFTEFVPCGPEGAHAERQHGDVPVILWAGRFLSWKHPDDAIRLAADLRKEGFSFRLRMVGGGEMERTLKDQVQAEALSETVCFTGFMNPEQVREQMKQADIFLFTSDHREGWGAVLNESMNSGCAVVANEGAGASPYLVEDGENGFLYANGDYDRLKACVRRLLSDHALRRQMGSRAYETIRDVWNPETAAKRLVSLCGQIVQWETLRQQETSGKAGEKTAAPTVRDFTLWAEGPLSPAPLIRPGLFNQRRIKEKKKR